MPDPILARSSGGGGGGGGGGGDLGRVTRRTPVLTWYTTQCGCIARRLEQGTRFVHIIEIDSIAG
jgi:hypothetical protein